MSDSSRTSARHLTTVVVSDCVLIQTSMAVQIKVIIFNQKPEGGGGGLSHERDGDKFFFQTEKCVLQEKIHTHPIEGKWKSKGEGGS